MDRQANILTEIKKHVQTMETMGFTYEDLQREKLERWNALPGNLPGQDCPVCKNKGAILVMGKDGEEFMRDCACLEKRWKSKTGIDSMGALRDKTFKGYQAEEPWQRALANKVKNYTQESRGEWLALLGQSGSGKTHLCSAVANHLITSGKRVVYMPWNAAVKQLKRLATDEAEYSRRLSRYLSAEALYIDDLFKGKVTDADITIAFEIINTRYNIPDAITLISSELLLDELRELDEAIAGRIKERCGDYVINIGRDKEKNYRFRQK